MSDGARMIVILGATSAMARALADEFAKAGHPVILAARDDEETAFIAADIRTRYEVNAIPMHFEAQAFEEHETFVNSCIESGEGAIGGVVLCYGFMDEQPKAQSDFDMARRTIDVNLTSAISVLEKFAAHFEARGEGFIAAISSVAGDRGRQSNYIYGASKAGLSAYLEGLRNRLYHLGVHVTTIKPGFVDTKMTFGLPGLFLVATPQQAAKAMYKAIVTRKNTAYVPWFWRYIMLIIRHVPDWQFKKMKM
ncbi:MAG: short-chain dehydrogenase [Candidatus Hydrogenedentota bacterium]